MHKTIKRLPIWLLGIYIIISLCSYHPSDPCLNVVSSQFVQNIGGQLGAYIADILLQAVGIISIVLVLFIFSHRQEQKWYWRCSAIILLLGGLSAFLTIIPVYKNWPWDSYGGALGIILKDRFTPYIGNIGFIFLSLSSSLLLFSYLFHFNWLASIKLPTLRKPKEMVKEKKVRIKNKEEKIIEDDEFMVPSLNFLNRKKQHVRRDDNNLQRSQLLQDVLNEFGVQGEVIKISNGPVVTLYEIRPSAGTKSSRVISLAGDVARSMSALSARIAVVPGRNAIGIELPNEYREMVLLRELLESEEYSDDSLKLPIALGHGISGKPMIADLTKMPHLLVAGTTGSGKSVAINSMILSLLYKLTPDECKFIMIDPKMLELSVYDNIPHLLSPVVTDPKKAVLALRWVVNEMENRYHLMSSLSVRNIEGYNKKIAIALQKGKTIERNVQSGFDSKTAAPIFEKIKLDLELMPFIVVVVDEMADLMLVAGKDIESSIQRLAQMARAAGIHIIMATQRPSVDVITGVIKANFPTRISFSVTSKIDSRTILGTQGAEQLLGMGDMLYMAGGCHITRAHGPFVSDSEVQNIADYLKLQGSPQYLQEMFGDNDSDDNLGGDDNDDLFNQAVEIIKRDKKVSISYIQRQLKIGYNRAANIVEKMEKKGIVSEANSTGKREILV